MSSRRFLWSPQASNIFYWGLTLREISEPPDLRTNSQPRKPPVHCCLLSEQLPSQTILKQRRNKAAVCANHCGQAGRLFAPSTLHASSKAAIIRSPTDSPLAFLTRPCRIHTNQKSPVVKCSVPITSTCTLKGNIGIQFISKQPSYVKDAPSHSPSIERKRNTWAL